MVVGARKLFTSALGLTLAGSLLGAPTAAGVPTDEARAELSTYGYSDVAVAPDRAPAGSPVQVHGYVGHGSRSPAAGEAVTIHFDPAGSAPRAAVATVTSDDNGWFAATFQPRTSGTYDILRPGEEEDTAQGVRTATFTSREAVLPVRSAVTSNMRNGYKATVRVTVQDVVTRVEPQTVHVDAGILTPGFPGNFSVVETGAYLVNRRSEGRYGVGQVTSATQEPWRTHYSATRTYRLSAVHPAGLYDVVFAGPVAVYTDPWDADLDGTRQDVRIPITRDPITTIWVRRASTTTIAASSTSFTGARNIELRGSVRKVQLISDSVAENRLAPNTALKLYFDPAGPAGPVYTKTVHTNSRGAYRTTVMTSRSGAWIAKYVGTSLQAPSKGSVTVTVR
ncbi:hypothetical protein ACFO6V_26715 [Promicromonospora alba]|uniref:Carboxypeptidase family protein n=1 Tax=Promicromonospora alba TaxID=1616110 RepID=A0ABV9HQD6_9MICO